MRSFCTRSIIHLVQTFASKLRSSNRLKESGPLKSNTSIILNTNRIVFRSRNNKRGEKKTQKARNGQQAHDIEPNDYNQSMVHRISSTNSKQSTNGNKIVIKHLLFSHLLTTKFSFLLKLLQFCAFSTCDFCIDLLK